MDRCLAAAPNGARVAIPKTTAMLNLNGIGLNAADLTQSQGPKQQAV